MRSQWEDYSGKLSSFDINDKALNICTTLERRAENMHDEQVKAASITRSGKGASATYTQRQGKGAASGERNALGNTTKWCNYCGKPGHTSLTCHAWKYGRNTSDIWTFSQNGKGKGKSGKSNGKGKGAKGEVFSLSFDVRAGAVFYNSARMMTGKASGAGCGI